MAKINNQAVLQKLMDELKLYPGADVIPTELAEKILPVFQINSDEVTVQLPTANTVESGELDDVGSVTIFTTPTEKFYLTGVSLSMQNSSTTLPGRSHVTVVINGVTKNIISVVAPTKVSSRDNKGAGATLSFPNPVLIDSESIIVLVNVTSPSFSYANIIGYKE